MRLMTNPVYRREMRVSSRSFRLALVLMAFNGILALVALLNMYSMLSQVQATAEIQYSSFLDLYMFVAVLEFVMLTFIMPAITAGSISGERERQTLDLMLSTRLTPAQIVTGKLASSLSTMVLLIVSSFPILALVFVYGGVTMRDMGMLLICYGATALFAGSLGVCCSALFQRSVLSTAVAYGVMASIVIGTYGINQLALFFHQMSGDAYLVSGGAGMGEASSGGFLYLLLLNPTSTFLMLLLRLAGRETAGGVAQWFGSHGESFLSRNWVGCSVVLQILMAGGLIWMAVKALSPGKRAR